jgi:hypothetical protein
MQNISVVCVFFAAKFTLTEININIRFKAILLLRVNRSQWDVYLVGKSMEQTAGTSYTE